MYELVMVSANREVKMNFVSVYCLEEYLIDNNLSIISNKHLKALSHKSCASCVTHRGENSTITVNKIDESLTL